MNLLQKHITDSQKVISVKKHFYLLPLRFDKIYIMNE